MSLEMLYIWKKRTKNKINLCTCKYARYTWDVNLGKGDIL